MPKLAIQMYSLRHEMAHDPEKLFKTLASKKLNRIQLDGMRGHNPFTIQQILQENDIIVDSMHIKHERFFNDLDGIVSECDLFNSKVVYCKYIEDEYQNEIGYRLTKTALLHAAKYLGDKGITVGLHSPEYDFNNTIDGLCVMDYICGDTIIAEPDTYWLSVANKDPLSYMRTLNQPIHTIHFKDIDTSCNLLDMKTNIRECGQGDVDFPSIIKWAKNVQTFAIEQDYSHRNMIDSLESSYHTIKHLMGDSYVL